MHGSLASNDCITTHLVLPSKEGVLQDMAARFTS